MTDQFPGLAVDCPLPPDMLLAFGYPGTDTLDFSATQTRAIIINLANPQLQVVAKGKLSLKLGSATAFENVVGGSQNDTLQGTGAANILVGGPGNDKLVGGADYQVLLAAE
ncbi:MAG: M10 family metallopeptidase C-terminal domain-containing protein [Gemmataceae bacterium]